MSQYDAPRSQIRTPRRPFLRDLTAVSAGAVALLLPMSRAGAEPGHRFEALAIADANVISCALPARSRVRPMKPRRVLIFYRTEGYVHASIPYANEALSQLGQRTGAYTSVLSDDMAMFTPQRLKEYDAVLFNNTTELKFAEPGAREALLRFVAQGKGLVGIHAASDSFYTWPEGEALLGGQFKSHPWTAKDTVAVKLDEPDHPLLAAFGGQGFWIRDEIYQILGTYSRGSQRVLLSLDMSQPQNERPANTLVRTDRDFPISWVRKQGRGRIFYTSLGHNSEIYQTRPVLQHFLDGIQFALGDLRVAATPSASQPSLPTPAHAPTQNSSLVTALGPTPCT